MRQLIREGVALAYEEAGRGAPPIVLVHDLGSDHTCFAPQFEHFRPRHRVVAVDLRGHGQSDRSSQAFTIGLLADDLAWLCYETGLHRPVLLGHGLGAIVALDLAARNPDLPSAVVAVEMARPSSVKPLTLPEHVAAPLLESMSSWRRADSIAAGNVPVLNVTLDARDVAQESGREVRLHLVQSSRDETGQREETTLPIELNQLVDAFLSEQPSRAPSDQRLLT